MAKFSYYLDTRGKKNKTKDSKFAVCVRANINKDTIYVRIPGAIITTNQYNKVFVRKSLDEQSISFREACNYYLVKSERIYASLGRSYNRSSFVKLFQQDGEIIVKEDFNSLVIEDIFNHYISNSTTDSLKYLSHIKTTRNVLCKYKPGVLITEITPEFLEQFKNFKLAKPCSPATIQSYFRDLRKIINYAKDTLKILPNSYQYPFGRGGCTIGNYFTSKLVMSKEEIQSIVQLNKFDSATQEYARDIWLLLYRCNGMNFADLLDLKWENIMGDYIIFERRKTKKTRKNNIKPIRVPITNGVKELLDKIGVKNSKFILGKLYEGYSASYFKNKNEKLRSLYNQELKKITDSLNLSVELKTETARDCYATTLLRNSIPLKDISEMLGHSNVVITEHYLSGLDNKRATDINKYIL
jgi:integrase